MQPWTPKRSSCVSMYCVGIWHCMPTGHYCLLLFVFGVTFFVSCVVDLQCVWRFYVVFMYLHKINNIITRNNNNHKKKKRTSCINTSQWFNKIKPVLWEEKNNNYTFFMSSCEGKKLIFLILPHVHTNVSYCHVYLYMYAFWLLLFDVSLMNNAYSQWRIILFHKQLQESNLQENDEIYTNTNTHKHVQCIHTHTKTRMHTNTHTT